MKYNLSLPSIYDDSLGEISWKEEEHGAVIVDLEVPSSVTSFTVSASGSPDAVLYHSRCGDYKVYGISCLDNGYMSLPGAFTSNVRGRSISLVNSTRSTGMGYMPNQQAMLFLNGGNLYKVDRYDNINLLTQATTATAVFGGQDIFLVVSGVIKKYTSNGNFLEDIIPQGMLWVNLISSGCIDIKQKKIYVGDDSGRIAIINSDSGIKLSEGQFSDGQISGYAIVGFNGEYLIITNTISKKLYWLDDNLTKITEADYPTDLNYSPLVSFDGRDILCLKSSNGTLYTYNIQDNWDYVASAYQADTKVVGSWASKLEGINDLYIFYFGQNTVWTTDLIKATIGYIDESKVAKDIFMDGLLIMCQSYNGKSFADGNPVAGQTEWDWYLNEIFKSDGLCDRINSVVSTVRTEINNSTFKEKIFIGMPVPMTDFSTYQWFIDQCISSITAFPNLQLIGFYNNAESNAGNIQIGIRNYIHSKGYKFIYAPFYNEPSNQNIVDNKSTFDGIYFQSNYPFGYREYPEGNERTTTRAWNFALQNSISPNIESMHDTYMFNYARDYSYLLWDMLLNYDVLQTTRMHFCSTFGIPNAGLSNNPFSRKYYDEYYNFLKGNRTIGYGKGVISGADYSVKLPSPINATHVKITPYYHEYPAENPLRTLTVSNFNVVSTSIQPTIWINIESNPLTFQSFGTYNINSTGNKKIGYIKFSSQNIESTDIVALEYSTDQQNWVYNQLLEIPNNKYCKINLYGDDKYYFRFSVLRGTDYFYSNTITSNEFYISPLSHNQQYIKLPNENYFWLTCDVSNRYGNEIYKWQISQDENNWTDLQINEINNGQGTYRSKFITDGKNGQWYYRLKIIRINEEYYSDIMSFNLSEMYPRNVSGYNPYLPKNAQTFKSAILSGFKLGSLKLGRIFKDNPSVAKLGSFKLSEKVLGSFVVIDIQLKTNLTLRRYYSNIVQSDVAYNLFRFYSNLTEIDIQYDLKKAESLIKLINCINPDICIEAKQLKDIKIKCVNNPNITVEQILNSQIKLTEEMQFQVDIEAEL